MEFVLTALARALCTVVVFAAVLKPLCIDLVC